MIPISIISLLALGAFVVWLLKPLHVPPHSKGSGLSSLNRPEGVTTEALIQSFKQNGFESVDGKSFDDILPDSISSRSNYGSTLVLRDTSIKTPNEFFIGIESETIVLFNSHDVTGEDAIADWQAHIETRSNLVQRLASRQE
jgi:hypothetical protein